MTMIITISNYKEKVGKSFIATELAKRVASCGYETLLMDFGYSYPSCANYLDVDVEEEQDVYEFLTTESEIEDLVLETDIDGLSLLAGSDRTKNIYPSRYGDFTSTNQLITQFKKVRDYECVVIDTMPKHSVLSVVHRVSDFVVIPINGYRSSIKASKKVIFDLQTYENMGWDGEYGVLLNYTDINMEIDPEVVNDLPMMPMEISAYGKGNCFYDQYLSSAEELLKSLEINDVLEWIFLQKGEIFYAD